MSARCPEGHLSQDPDYCDQCGLRITSGQDSYGYRSEDRSAPVGSYGGGTGRGGAGGGGYDPLGIRRDSNPGGRGGARGGDPYGGDQYGAPAGGYGGAGYDDRSGSRAAYGPGSDGYDPAAYGRSVGRDDEPPYAAGRNRDTGGYSPRGGRGADDPDAAYGRGGRDADGGRGGYGASRDTDGYSRGAGGGGREDYGREPQYGRDAPEPGYGRGGGGGRDDRDAAGYGGGGGRGGGYGYEDDPLGGERDRAAGAGRYPQCPNCRAYYEPGARFCENCGLDFTTGHMPGAGGRRGTSPPVEPGYGEPVINSRGAASWNGGGGGGPAVATTWEAVVEAEREYYDSGDDHRVPFPSFYPRRVFPLTGPRLLVGRRSESRGIHPEIDLSGAPEDPGISRAHAIFERQQDGSYALLDPGSTNGTRLNDEPEPIEPHGPVPLQDGDRVYLGAWTRITVRAR